MEALKNSQGFSAHFRPVFTLTWPPVTLERNIPNRGCEFDGHQCMGLIGKRLGVGEVHLGGRPLRVDDFEKTCAATLIGVEPGFEYAVERPAKQMLSLEQENRILNAASPHLRLGIVLLVQTGGRTYSEGFRLRWDQVDWENRLIHFGNDVKTPGSSEPLPLTDLAFRVLLKWKEQSRSDSPYIFPSLRKPGAPVGSVKTTWRSTLRRAGMPHFPIYNLRHAFCTSWVAPDAVIERAMRHTSPGDETHLPTQHGRAGARSDGEGE